jgi:hypothetical protein
MCNCDKDKQHPFYADIDYPDGSISSRGVQAVQNQHKSLHFPVFLPFPIMVLFVPP